MHSTRKNGDNPLADVISQRREMLQAIRSTPRLFDLDVEVKPEPRITHAVFRSAHSARSTPVDPGTMSWHELHSPLPEESAGYLAALLGDDVVTMNKSSLKGTKKIPSLLGYQVWNRYPSTLFNPLVRIDPRTTGDSA